MDYSTLKAQDDEVFALVEEEEKRQTEGLEMIPSENYASEAVLEASGSIFTDKYAENYPGKRYYGSCGVVDKLERLCQKRARAAFAGADGYHVNVQPYSGSPANIAVYFGLLEPGDTIMAMRLDQGGHLTHGSPVSASGKLWHFVPYGADPETEQLNYDELEKLAKEHKPKLIVSGFTAYPRSIDFKRMHEIAKSVGAISMVDMSHISGLIIGGVHPSPFPFTDVVTTTTHKTLRGPRGAMIFSKEEYKDGIDRGVFPGLQGGPHEHTIAAIAVALKEAMKPSFKEYAAQIVANAKALAEGLLAEGLRLISGGTDNHLMLIDFRPFGPGRGIFVEKALEAAHISANKSPIPNDPSPPYYPSGLRLGTPALTSRGMKEAEMREAAKLVAAIVKEFATTPLPEAKEERLAAIKEFSAKLKDHPVVRDARAKVNALATKFPVPGIKA